MLIKPPRTSTLPSCFQFFHFAFREAVWRHCYDIFGSYHACCCYNDCDCLQANRSTGIEYIPGYTSRKSCSQITKYYCERQYHDIYHEPR